MRKSLRRFNPQRVNKRNLLFSFISMAILTLIAAAGAFSCPVCYGAGESSRFDGMNWAILAMVGITGAVLSGISAFFVAMRKRIRMHRDGTLPVSSKGIVEWNNS